MLAELDRTGVGRRASSMEAPMPMGDTKAAAVLPLHEANQCLKPGIVGRPEFTTHPWRFFTAPIPSKFLTKIHGKWYDLTEFEKHHPGGPVALGLARGRDATVMFESNHPFTSRAALNAILAKYEMDASEGELLQTLEQQHGIPEHEYEWPSAFGEALKFQVKEYFQGEANRRNVSLFKATKATPARWIEIAIMAALSIATFPGFFRGDWRFLVLCPLMVWIVGVNTFHDACHFTLTSNWRINAVFTYLYPYFSSPFGWYHQHNIGHHCYTNICDRDPDLHHHSWMKREHRDVKWSPLHRFQSSWMHTLLRWSLALQTGLASFADLWMLQSSLYNDVVPMMDISGLRRIVHIFGRLLTIVFVHAWPFLWLELSRKSYAFALVPYAILSFLFMMNTQINHLLPHTTHIEDSDFYKHEARTAQDFGVGCKWIYLLSGGLNYQVCHHLFPTVNHCHLPHLQPIVARLCEKYDVPYSTSSGYVEAITLHHEHSKSLSSRLDNHAE